ncbi:MAG TPA: hypothetical protein VF915_00025, partial [Reyranella sp.]
MRLRPSRFLSVITTTFVGLVMAATAMAAPARAQTHEPILFVHGFDIFDLENGTFNCTVDGNWIWNDMINNFRGTWPDVEVRTMTYNSCDSSATTAAKVAQEVDALLDKTGAAKVDIVTHSLGSISTRYYLKNFPGALNKVDHWVSLGGPNHGSNDVLVNFCADVLLITSCREVSPYLISPFMVRLNTLMGDESPGPVHYGT